MQIIAHPFFDTLYVDPEEGLYWQQELDILGRPVHVALYIENAADVSDEHIAFAQTVITDREILARKAIDAVKDNAAEHPQGACARYIHDHLLEIDPEAARALLPLPEGERLTPHNFIDCMTIDMFAVYPSEEMTPLIIEFTIGEEFSDAVLSVNFTPEREIAVIDYQE